MGLSRCPECGRVAEPPACFACGYEWPEDVPASSDSEEQWAVPDKGAAPLKRPEPIDIDMDMDVAKTAPSSPAPLPISDSMDELGDIFGGPDPGAGNQPPPVPDDDDLDMPGGSDPDDDLAGISLQFDDALLPEVDDSPLPDVDDSPLPDVDDIALELDDEAPPEEAPAPDSAGLDDLGIDTGDIDVDALADIDLDGGLDDEPAEPPVEFDADPFDDVPQSNSMPDPELALEVGLTGDDPSLPAVDDLDAPAPPPLQYGGISVSPEEIGTYSTKIEKFAEEFENEGKIAEAAFLYELKAFLDSLA